SGGARAVRGTPPAATHWFEGTVTVTVTGGVLYVSNGTGSSNNKIDAIDVTQVLPGPHFAGGFTSTAGLQLNGSAKQNGTALRLTDGAGNEAGSAFTATAVSVAKFTTSFDFRMSAGASIADGLTFTIQGVGGTALGAAGGALGYAGIGKSVAGKVALFHHHSGGVDST